ncbi:tungsten formylmethanofuran dehydrogenase [Segetibacter sp. 3557_3]|uniref:alpha-ketoacid dehydrogenase subunit alpha/beta n=1 Tax=Segetibacter sp. 3557_3 TaxID=2547429 RepID=UPI001058B3A0|nr:alpha-ketoacid dehydrogenase subunit alpha/beta [Segetibacter sp. 3557_3]TDH25687.1 tungsten formylmethanofuran dehydrogenase [Segetibacter sp. 3557_3]
MLTNDILLRAYGLMITAKTMAETYEANRSICKYVHSTSRGHEAIQIATGMQLLPCDYFSPYYRDDSMMLAAGFKPEELMLQLLAKAADPFSGGRSYYCHPSSKATDKPGIIHQSSATGMQAIPTTGIAQGLKFLAATNSPLLRKGDNNEQPFALCSLGDNSVTEGEVSEALQVAVLWQLPIIYLVQDNQWGISVSAPEARAMNAYEYAAGFKGLKPFTCDGSNFIESYTCMYEAIRYVRDARKPVLVHARVPLLGHHTSGVRKEFYRTTDDLEQHAINDPIPRLRKVLLQHGVSETNLVSLEQNIGSEVQHAFENACAAEEPLPSTVTEHVFAPATVIHEEGERAPENGRKVLMVDAALFAIEEIMQDHPECILYGQDVGKRLGGVFREAATLSEKFGEHRVFNTAIQEAYIIGSTIGLSAVGVRPIVEVQFADYIYPGFNQLASEISKSCYLSGGKFPVSMVLRVPIGAYGGGGPYHSGSIESTLLTIKGIKVCYPSNSADMKGLMKAAFYDPNPVIMLEHKGLYWSKVPGTEDAKTIEPARSYRLPLGKANIVLCSDAAALEQGETICIVTYGIGVYWSKAAALEFPGRVEIIDLRTLFPLDEELVYARVKAHGKCLVITEEQVLNSFAESLAYRIMRSCFQFLDKEVEVLGALDLPAVPINLALEAQMLPTVNKVKSKIKLLLQA